MRIPEHHNDKYNLKLWSLENGRVQKVHEDKFENELEDSINKRKSEAKKKATNNSPKEVDLKDTKHHKILSVAHRFSSWG